MNIVCGLWWSINRNETIMETLDRALCPSKFTLLLTLQKKASCQTIFPFLYLVIAPNAYKEKVSLNTTRETMNLNVCRNSFLPNMYLFIPWNSALKKV